MLIHRFPNDTCKLKTQYSVTCRRLSFRLVLEDWMFYEQVFLLYILRKTREYLRFRVPKWIRNWSKTKPVARRYGNHEMQLKIKMGLISTNLALHSQKLHLLHRCVHGHVNWLSVIHLSMIFVLMGQRKSQQALKTRVMTIHLPSFTYY